MSAQPLSVLFADPPWWYANRKTGGERNNTTKFGGGCRKHYPVMPDEALLSLATSIQGVMAANSACLMWATDPRKDFAIELLKAWGFRFVTEPYHWFKTTKDGSKLRYGPGTYTASNHESVILGVKGSMPVFEQMTPSVIITPRFDHSVKPKLHRRILRLFPWGRRLEMFARRLEKHWEAIGNGVTGRDITEDLDNLNREINGMAWHQTQLFGVI